MKQEQIAILTKALLFVLLCSIKKSSTSIMFDSLNNLMMKLIDSSLLEISIERKTLVGDEYA